MSRKKKIYGDCRICGENGKLSFEHVPPEKAFNNNRRYYEAGLMDLIEFKKESTDLKFDELYKKRIAKLKQGGIGFYTLCERCNNDTGGWYGGDYVDWVIQSMSILLKSKGRPSLIYPTYFYPLRVIKQIITMFFSLNPEGFSANHKELKKFILNKSTHGLSPKYKIYCYYNIEGVQRYIGGNLIGNVYHTETINLSELSFPPFGFVFTIDSEPPDSRLVDISHFAQFDYDRKMEFYQKFSVLPTHLPYIPGDYRSKSEIDNAILASKLKQMGLVLP